MSSHQSVYELLSDDLNIAKENYPNNIFAIFQTDEINSTAIILPSFEDLIYNKRMVSQILYNGNRIITCIDLRLFFNVKNNYYSRSFCEQMIESIQQEEPAILFNIYENTFNLDKFKKTLHEEKTMINVSCLEYKLQEIMKAHIKDGNENLILFYKNLTDAEKLALNCIIEYFGAEGTISQAKIATLAGVPKTTVAKLIFKMDMYKVAIINNLGPKGTYFKVISHLLLE